jgi:hypothetical protein
MESMSIYTSQNKFRSNAPDTKEAEELQFRITTGQFGRFFVSLIGPVAIRGRSVSLAAGGDSLYNALL